MNTNLIQVALRNGALYLESERPKAEPYNPENPSQLSKSTLFVVEQLLKHGFTLDEKALRLLNQLDAEDKAELLQGFQDVFGENLNWTPLVRNWIEPTYEGLSDHLVTYFYNMFVGLDEIDPSDSVKLPCGHYIPKGTFDLSRYTGCPFCGKPFETNDFVYKGQGTNIRTLTGWTEDDAYRQYVNLLKSTVPLNGSQIDSLEILLDEFELPDDIEIPVRETAIVVASALFDYDDYDGVKKLIKTPADVMRMLWYEKSDQLKVIAPKTLLLQAIRQARYDGVDELYKVARETRQKLKLKYSRTECRLIARLLNEMEMSAEKMCEVMNPKRGMWVRMIRALRLAEYAKRKDYGHLREMLDLFYRKEYIVVQGLIDAAVEHKNYKYALELLRQRPGMFARQLFAMMLHTNPYTVLAEFRKVLDRLPLRLIFDLANYADYYFNEETDKRPIRTITGLEILVPVNPRLKDLPKDERENLVESICKLSLDALRVRYALTPMPGQKIYIDPSLFRVALPVGNRTQAKEDFLVVPQGTTFPVEGDKVRLFLQWGKGMPAAHIDLDLSVSIIYKDKVVKCGYFNLSPLGATHSGDIRQIPDKVGTAEYIELDVPALRADGAVYVGFTANSYTLGSVLPNAMVGWMTSDNPMTVSNETGVAYDPSCVQHMVKIDDKMLQKGVVFGALDVKRNEVIWLEMQFDGRTVIELDYMTLIRYIYKLESKITIGKALEVMAQARGMEIVDAEHIDADTQVYDRQWAYDIAAVTSLLLPPDPPQA